MFSVVGVNGVLVFGWQTEVVDLLSKVQWGRTDADQLEIAIGQHLRLHQLAYKLLLWRPKTSLGFAFACCVEVAWHIVELLVAGAQASCGYESGQSAT